MHVSVAEMAKTNTVISVYNVGNFTGVNTTTSLAAPVVVKPQQFIRTVDLTEQNGHL